MIPIALIIFMVATVGLAAPPEVRVIVERNTGTDATPQFKFKNVPSPTKGDADAHPIVRLILGERDPAGAELTALSDGVLPEDEDQPGANFFPPDLPSGSV